MNILDKLAEHAKERVSISKNKVSLEQIKKEAYGLPFSNFKFENALKKKELSFICECKKASPSKRIIDNEFDYIKIAKDYEQANADCLSVLTEPKWFLGSDTHLKEITSIVDIPCIRKDFIVDEYMIYESKLLGASAILLIVSILNEKQLKKYIEICDELGLSALVEAHDENEIRVALECNARLIGVNNRNLKDFSVDTNNSKRLRSLIPSNVIFVSESGIKDEEDIKTLKEIGVDAVLIVETLMKAKDKKATLKRLRGN